MTNLAFLVMLWCAAASDALVTPPAALYVTPSQPYQAPLPDKQCASPMEMSTSEFEFKRIYPDAPSTKGAVVVFAVDDTNDGDDTNDTDDKDDTDNMMFDSQLHSWLNLKPAWVPTASFLFFATNSLALTNTFRPALAGPLILMMLPSCDAVRVHGSGKAGAGPSATRADTYPPNPRGAGAPMGPPRMGRTGQQSALGSGDGSGPWIDGPRSVI